MVQTQTFGRLDGREVIEATLDSDGATVAVLNYGCIIRDWQVGVSGHRLPVVLGFESFEEYRMDRMSFGIIAGRVANRIARGRFTLEGKTYQLPVDDTGHTLHGGSTGLGKRLWQLETDAAQNAVRLAYFSPDGEEGFPGNVEFEVIFSLQGTTLSCEMRAVPDRPTPINLAQHNYYNLDGSGDVREHVVGIAASRYTPVGEDLIPSGEVAGVRGEIFDFRNPVSFADNDPQSLGVDINLILDEGRHDIAPAAIVRSPKSGLSLRLWTDQPAIQVFNARVFGPFAGFCLEAQHYPDSVNHGQFPSIIRTPETPYFQKLEVDISPGI